MAEIVRKPIPPQEWVKIDCSKQSANPEADVAIHASRYHVRPGGRMGLSVRGAHKLCEDGCYKWRIIKGGGDLDLIYGKRNYYTAPAENPECINNPTIQLEYCGVPMDTVVIGISDSIIEGTAFFRAGAFREGYWPRWNTCAPYEFDMFWCGEERYYKSCIVISRYSCDGRILGRDRIGLRQCCVGLTYFDYKVLKNQWQANSMYGFQHGAFGILKGQSYAYAKQDLLDAWVFGQHYKDYKTIDELFPEDWYPGDPLPEGVTLEGPGEFPPHWYAGDAPPDNLKLEEDTTFPFGWTAGDPLPEGVTVEEDAWFPPDWTVTDPLPEGITLEIGSYFPDDWTAGDKLPEGASFPKGEYFDKGWTSRADIPENVTMAEGASFPSGWRSGDPLPEGVTLDPGAVIPFDWQPGDDVPEGLNLPTLWPKDRPKWWEKRWEGGLLTERGILDVRTPEMFDEECCVPEEEWQPS